MIKLLKQHIRFRRQEKIRRLIDLQGDGTVLDCSCSNGSFLSRLHAMSSKLKLFGIDISGEDIKRAQSNFPHIHFRKESADKLSFKDGTFDVVFSIMAFHHYPKPAAFLTEAFRVLKSEGVLYLADIMPKYLRTQKIQNRIGCTEPYYFEKYYVRRDLEAMLESLSLRVDLDVKVTNIPQRIRLLRIQRVDA